MNRSVLVPVAALTLLALAAPRACAGVISGPLSTAPSVIRLVGASASGPDTAAGRFTVVVRDWGLNTINNAQVDISLSNIPDFVLCSDQRDPDEITNCAAKTVRKFTNAQGEATFTLLGASIGSAQSMWPTVNIFGNGVLIVRARLAAFDLDGSGGVGAGDLSVWLGDFASGMPWTRSDYDGSGSVGANDLSQLLWVYGAGSSTQSCVASCP